MTNEKLSFILTTFPSLLRKLDPSTKGLWGKMNVQQMIEHMSDTMRDANGKTLHSCLTPPERIPKMKEFIMSDKEFRPDTKNALMGEEPLPVRNLTVQESITELEMELKDFENHFKSKPDLIVTNPFFGDLNFNEWVHLIYKHAVHHLKQFGAMGSDER